jgi:hypothetical protein
MVQCLREGFVYSEKRVRDLLFTEIEELVASAGGPHMLSSLTREAAHRGRCAAESAGLPLSNWDTAAKAIVNAMLHAGVFQTHGQVVMPGVAARASRITGLEEGFRDRTEAYLLEYLIRRLGNVKIQDHLALAHALFRQFDPRVRVSEIEDRVVTLMATLADRIVLRDDETYAPLEEAQFSSSSNNAATA